MSEKKKWAQAAVVICGTALSLVLLQRLRNKRRTCSDSGVWVLGSLLIGQEAVDFIETAGSKVEETKSLYSEDCGDSTEIRFENDSDEPLRMRWIDDSGECHHHHQIPPARGDLAIQDGSVEASIVECTQTGHMFVVDSFDGWKPNHASELAKKFVAHSPPSPLLCIYKPTSSPTDSEGRHVITFSKDANSTWHAVPSFEPTLPLIDTTSKQYSLTQLAGFTVHYEPGIWATYPELKSQIEEDLSVCAALLPVLPPFVEIWLNDSLTFGRGEVGSGCCYHPDKDWLRSQGCHPEKACCIEFYTVSDYPEDRKLWGTGGLLLHEMCHAYHHQCIADGYDNASIQEVYDLAMAKGRYDKVAVHGSQGKNGPIRAYACTNSMEYFAELSVAFLCCEAIEMNKWYPFNRAQLMQHDPDAFEVFSQVWQKNAALEVIENNLASDHDQDNESDTNSED